MNPLNEPTLSSGPWRHSLLSPPVFTLHTHNPPVPLSRCLPPSQVHYLVTIREFVSQVENTQSQFTFNDSRRSHSVLMHITVSDTREYLLKYIVAQ